MSLIHYQWSEENDLPAVTGDFQYMSPSTVRYGPKEMRFTWSLYAERLRWRWIWYVLLHTQEQMGLVPAGTALRADAVRGDINLTESRKAEERTRHDVAAELQVYRGQMGKDGRLLHLGATASDIVENARTLAIKDSLSDVEGRLAALIGLLSDFCEIHAGTEIAGRTHLQIADPTTLGARFGMYLYEITQVWTRLKEQKDFIRTMGFTGSTGSSVGYIAAFLEMDLAQTEEDAAKQADNMNRRACASLGLSPFPISNQIAPKYQEYEILTTLAALAAALHKMHQDIRLMAMIGEIALERKRDSVGSTAMPWKINPIASENVCSLARMVASFPGVFWDNWASNALERTLDDSANARYIFPEAFLLTHHIVQVSIDIIPELWVNMDVLGHTLNTHRETMMASVAQVLAQLRGKETELLLPHGSNASHGGKEATQRIVDWVDRQSRES